MNWKGEDRVDDQAWVCEKCWFFFKAALKLSDRKNSTPNGACWPTSNPNNDSDYLDGERKPEIGGSRSGTSATIGTIIWGRLAESEPWEERNFRRAHRSQDAREIVLDEDDGGMEEGGPPRLSSVSFVRPRTHQGSGTFLPSRHHQHGITSIPFPISTTVKPTQVMVPWFTGRQRSRDAGSRRFAPITKRRLRGCTPPIITGVAVIKLSPSSGRRSPGVGGGWLAGWLPRRENSPKKMNGIKG